MINKRPFNDEDSCEVALKHPRQLECVNELAPFVDIVPSLNAPQKSFSGDNSFNKCQDGEGFSSDFITEVSKQTKESENGVSGSISHCLWVNNGMFEADARLETAAHLSLFPEYFEHGDRLRGLLQSDDTFASPVDYSPEKLVPIGPGHQAYVPEWDQRVSKLSDHQTDPQNQVLHGSGLDLVVNADEEKMGTCVISMPKPEVSLHYCSQDGASRNDCMCIDEGSVRCVRQHVMEAREKLKENIGARPFEELGFCDMGEEVAKRWTEEEEHIFHEVILTNPSTVGKNFWDHLSMAFPSRKTKDLVSYYFNVFILRKRAGQNRFDQLNIDSDNDEWEKTELGGLDDEDSVVESPADQEASAYCQQDNLEDCHEDLEDANEVDDCEHGADLVCRVGTDEEDGGDVDNGSGADVKDSPGNSEINLLGKIPSNNREDSDVQDDSCTSYEYQRDRIELCFTLDEATLRTDARDCSVG
ncbi:ELM2 domain protein [Parasponia andersonii]|uniref:ELM2 domain protein n=1 Tax=Parasponia andersonii TaxID=3476 RepID=A0A2P5AW91_PARAD|nr:ELM2 domain protein [Parasponia andersonii]